MVDRISEIGGVYVDSISIETVSQVTGQPRGASRDFDFFPSEMIDGEKVEDVTESLKELIRMGGYTGPHFKIKYKLLIRARSMTTAKVKARSYARLVNPFSPSVVEVPSASQTSDKDWLSDIGPLQEFYDVTVSVKK